MQTTGANSASKQSHRSSAVDLARPYRLSTNGAVAVAIAAAGMPVFPVREAGPRAKQPYTEHGHHDATMDVPKIRAWWSQWPGSLVGIPTGPGSGLWVLDVDGLEGRRSLADLLARFGFETARDLSRVIVETPGGGLHLYLRLQPGERPRNRAKDIRAGLDTRGVKADGSAAGYVIGAGSTLPNGRGYRLIEGTLRAVGEQAQITKPRAIAEALKAVRPAPRGLLYLATFNGPQRQRIAASNELKAAIREATASEWQSIHEAHEAELSRSQKKDRGEFSQSLKSGTGLGIRMRRQALHDLGAASDNLASLCDGRRGEIFITAARLARYVANEVLTAAELQDALGSAWAACGGATKHGQAFATGAIRRALKLGRNDPLPPLARQFRHTQNMGRGPCRDE